MRIVSLVPSLTETLFVLGGGDDVVGVTRFCVEPPAARRCRCVGGTKDPDLAAVRALEPDLVLMDADENRREDHAALVAAGTRVEVCSPGSVPEAIEVVGRIGRLVGRRGEAEELVARMRGAVAEARSAVGGHRRTRYFCAIWRRPWMSFAAGTYVCDLLDRAGGENVLGGRRERYFQVGLEEVAALGPEVVLLPDEPYPFRRRHIADLAPLAATPALRSGRVHLLDGKALAWYGPRLIRALATLSELLAPRG